jgi:PhnB protein
MKCIRPFLQFPGNCEEAFLFYQKVFGGKLESIIRYREVDPCNWMDKVEGEKIMHIQLAVNENTVLYGADIPNIKGNDQMQRVILDVTADSLFEATKMFWLLSLDGIVALPFEKSSPGEYLGMVYDRFGIAWMVEFEEFH